jgi:subtilase family serine protease
MRVIKLSVLAAATALVLQGCGGGGGLEETVAVAPTEATASDVSITPMAGVSTIGVQATITSLGGLSGLGQNPSSIRNRYGFSTLTTPAKQGSGQVIAIISAYNNPNAAADLAKFSTQHGLPQCQTVTTVVGMVNGQPGFTNLPKATPGSGCKFQVINSTSSGGPSVGALRGGGYAESIPAPDGVWMAESSMDIEWAHAMAPMATIVLVQAPSPFASSLANAAKYAGTFANVVSMSWGAPESAFATTCPMAFNRATGKSTLIDPTCTDFTATQASLFGPYANGSLGYDTMAGFDNPAVTYVAASGDFGNKPMWPSVSSNVLSVGGTNDSTTVDTGWSGSGGGTTAYYPTPTYQKYLGFAKRTVPDVALVADSKSPVSVYFTPSTQLPDAACVKAKGAAACGWYAGYGTSVSAPQWAGLAAVVRAVRAESKLPVNNFTAALYGIASCQSSYKLAFGDVTSGNNGYAAKVGYDMVTGLGTPNAAVLVGLMNK